MEFGRGGNTKIEKPPEMEAPILGSHSKAVSIRINQMVVVQAPRQGRIRNGTGSS
jgi:hypothetical protein